MKKIFTFLLVIVVIASITVPAFAYDYNGYEMPDPDETMMAYAEEGFTYFTFIIDNTLASRPNRKIVYQSTAPMYQNNVNGYVLASESLKYYMWEPWSDGTWYQNGSNYYTLAKGQEPNSGRMQVVWASYDFNDNVGNKLLDGDENFFPTPPLAEVVQGVTAETLTTKTLPEMAGTMKVLVACGVGLMACLVVLSLFGKRSLIFRN